MNYNYRYEYIDRIIIAAENEIKDKKHVRVELVETLIRTLRGIITQDVVKTFETKNDQALLNYD